MNKVNIEWRSKSVSAALGSVRAEGLQPSVKTQKRLHDYAKGAVSAQQIRRVTVQEMRQTKNTVISE